MPTMDVSYGEIIDRLCIEEVRYRAILSSGSVEDVVKQGAHVLTLWESLKDLKWTRLVYDAHRWLMVIHAELWRLEDSVRMSERTQLVNYKRITEYNDLRARIKRKVNEVTISSQELKQHELFGQQEIYPDVFLNLVGSGASTEVLSSV